jgi:hypothetical protein
VSGLRVDILEAAAHVLFDRPAASNETSRRMAAFQRNNDRRENETDHPSEEKKLKMDVIIDGKFTLRVLVHNAPPYGDSERVEVSVDDAGITIDSRYAAPRQLEWSSIIAFIKERGNEAREPYPT